MWRFVDSLELNVSALRVEDTVGTGLQRFFLSVNSGVP